MKVLKSLTVCTLAGTMLVPPSAIAQSRVVTPAELHAAVVSASETRQKNENSVMAALSTPKAQKALRVAQVDLNTVKTAVASLSDEELGRLSVRAARAEADFAAGRLSERDLLWVLVGIAVLILIIVAVD